MESQITEVSWLKKIGMSILLLICGVLVFVLGSNYYSIFPTNDSQLYRGGVALAFLGAAIYLRRNPGRRLYAEIAYAFFIAITAYFVTSLTLGFRDTLLNQTLRVPMNTPRFAACVKIFEMVVAVVVILVLSKLWGADLGSLFIKRGRLGLAVFIGLSLLVINTGTGIVTGAALGRPGDQLVAGLPWALLFSLANGFMEELWFRGLFLRRFVPVIGKVGAILVTSIIFTGMHSAATYMNPLEAVLFQVIIFPMALLFGYLMVKLDNIWGSALYHAGSDVFLFYLMGM